MASHNFKSVTELFSESSQAVRRNLGAFITLSIISILDLAWQIGSNIHDKTHGSPWGSIIADSFTGTHSGNLNVGSGFLFFILFLAGIALSLMAGILAFKAARKETVQLSEVWEEFKGVWWKLFLVELVMVIFIGVSFALLIIPGIFVLPRLILAPYYYLDHKTGVMDTLNHTWDMSKGFFGPVWVVLLFGIVLSLPAIVPVVGPIVSFILALLYSVAMPYRYFEVKNAKKA